MAFSGYLLKRTADNKEFPHKYIALESWKSKPNQREEIKAYRDDNTRELTRVTAAGRKTSFSFELRPKLTLAQKQEIQDFFTSVEVDPDQRKIQLTYWNDEDNDYKTGYFYRPNMEFPIYKITKNDIIYDKMTLEFVEY